jgi:hypothetical protein
MRTSLLVGLVVLGLVGGCGEEDAEPAGGASGAGASAGSSAGQGGDGGSAGQGGAGEGGVAGDGGAAGNGGTAGDGGEGGAAGDGGEGGAAGDAGAAGTGVAGAAGQGGAALVDTFEAYLVGRFDSTAQAKKDPSFFEIQVETCRVEVPALGPRVLYIEQAQMAALNQPYRQRLYVLEAGEDPATQVVSRVFEFKTASKYIGLCSKEPAPMISAAQTEEKAGCAVRMAWDGAQFVGGTVDKGCPSTLSGATYATSEVTLRADGFTSWDRGYDAADKQVWGAVKGGYIFDRKTPLAP